MIQRPDIAVYSPDNKLQLVVEVKNKKGATAEWAANMRRNLFAHSVVPNSPYFLLALPDHFYLWKNPGSTIDIKPPDYTANSKPILEPYLNKSSHYLDTMSEYGLELIINSWLNKIVNANLTRETANPHEAWLLDSGLYNAIKHGYVKTEATV
jgi:hypothetical protein